MASTSATAVLCDASRARSSDSRKLSLATRWACASLSASSWAASASSAILCSARALRAETSVAAELPDALAEERAAEALDTATLCA
jgi:hypothetical protein